MKLVLTGAALVAALFAQQEDVTGSKDHTLLSRMPGSFITEYKQQFDAFEFPASADRKQTVEGTVTNIQYFYKSAESQPSPLQVLRNYQNAVKSLGGEVVYERRGDDGGETTLKIVKAEQTVWIYVQPQLCAPTNCYRLVIAEPAAMVQEVMAGQMLAALNKTGYIALYIGFETDSWAITPAGQSVVAQIAELLRQNPALAVGIEGHTDSTGVPLTNQMLSENRARAVMAAVAKQGIAEARMTAAGFGSDKPRADNRTEAGRATNRRVELVKRLK